MNDNDSTQEVANYLIKVYPGITFSFNDYEITGIIDITRTDGSTEYAKFILTKNSQISSATSQYEESWLKRQKWICYNKSYSDMYGCNNRFGGDNAVDVFADAIKNLHYRLNLIIERAEFSKLCLERTKTQAV